MTNPSQSLKPIDLMPNPGKGDDFRTIEEVVVHVSPVPTDKQVYQQGWTKEGGQEWAISATGLAILMAAAGVKAVPGGNYFIASEVNHPNVLSWHYTIEWGSGSRMFEADYTLDLRGWITVGDEKIRGPRFDESYHKFRRNQIIEANKLAFQAKQDIVERAFDAMTPEQQAEVERMANILAEGDMRTQRIHLKSKAQTGALDRALRKLFGLKASYTLAELQRGFRVYRMQDNFERFQAALGEKNMQILFLAQAQKRYGLTDKDLASATRALNAATQVEALPELSESPDEPPITETNDHELVDNNALNNAVAGQVQVLESTEELAKPEPEPEAKPTVNGIQIPWRGNEYADPEAKLHPVNDAALIDRTPKFIDPKKHLTNHLKKHYKVSRWGEMTLKQGVDLWAHLDKLQAEAGDE